MLILGLTGSIGMGKSTTAKLFAEAGVPVYDADAEVHKLYEGEAAPAIEAAFPGTTSNGKVDRAKTFGEGGARSRRHEAARADRSSDAGRLAAKILRRRGSLRCACRGRGRAAVVRDRRRKARRCRGGGDDSPEIQRERVLARGTMDAAKLDSILARQLPDAEKRRRADFVVDTSHGLDPVRAQIADILAAVVKMPKRRT